MVDKYSSFAEMLKHETEGRDFTVSQEIRGSSVAIVAPHGGGIEPGTSELAAAIADDGRQPSALRLRVARPRGDGGWALNLGESSAGPAPVVEGRAPVTAEWGRATRWAG